MPKDTGIGASPKRREDVRFLTGAGNYTDDINIRGQAYMRVLRSDIANGKINGINTSAAAAMPGVILIFTGDDFEPVGNFSVTGTDKSVVWGDVTLAACVPHNYPLEDIEPGLEETAFYDPASF